MDDGFCPLSATEEVCGDHCQWWMDQESCCAVRSIARSLRQLASTLTEIQHIFEQQETT